MKVSKPFFAKVGMEFLGLEWMADHMIERFEAAISVASNNEFIYREFSENFGLDQTTYKYKWINRENINLKWS